jgi:hypothetical protein
MNGLRIVKFGIAALCFFVPTREIIGQQGKVQESDKTSPLVIARINGPITLDGLSDEPAWKGIESLPMKQRKPHFGEEPSEKTIVLIGYDDDCLYVACRMYDSEPEKIQTVSMQRDVWTYSADSFYINIDSFNDHDNSRLFMVTPAGTRTDVEFLHDAEGAPERNTNTSWNAVWDVATVRNSEGWFAEMRIPFSSLKFQVVDGKVVMGITAARWNARKFETSLFPLIPEEFGTWGTMRPSQTHDVIFEGIRSRNPLYMTPYALGGLGQKNDLNESETAYNRTDRLKHEAGLDIKYGVTDNLTLDVTLNTDFAQVEADDQQINLTRYSLFFPENRLFFQERSGNFEFGFEESNSLFYSRRIGLHEGNQVRIYGGARLVGRTGPWDIGLLSMQTEKTEELPSENFSVFRLRRQVFNPYSYVGGIVTTRIGVNGAWNAAYGVDGIIRMFGDDYLSLKWAQTFDESKSQEAFSLDPARVFVDWERRKTAGLHYKLNYSRAGENYLPGLGYENRKDFTRFGDSIQYGWIPDKESKLLNHAISLEGFAYLRNGDRSIESAEIGPGWSFETKGGSSGSFSFKRHIEDVEEEFSFSDDACVPAGKYSYYEFEGTYDTPRAGQIRFSSTLNAGTFYDGNRISLTVSPTWNVSQHIYLTGSYQINRLKFTGRGQEFTGHIGRLRLQLMPTIKHTLTAFIQYNSANDLILTNVRYRYNPREGHDFFIVYNEGFNTDRQREIPFLPLTINRTIMVKYSYMFNIQ